MWLKYSMLNLWMVVQPCMPEIVSDGMRPAAFSGNSSGIEMPRSLRRLRLSDSSVVKIRLLENWYLSSFSAAPQVPRNSDAGNLPGDLGGRRGDVGQDRRRC